MPFIISQLCVPEPFGLYCLGDVTQHYHSMTCRKLRKWPRAILHTHTHPKKTDDFSSVCTTSFHIQGCILTQTIKRCGKADVEKTHQGALKIGCISLCCWGRICSQATCSVKCELQWPHPCDTQPSVNGLGCGSRGYIQSNGFKVEDTNKIHAA